MIITTKLRQIHLWICEKIGAVPLHRYDVAKEMIAQLRYELAMTNAPLWHGPWKRRKDGTGQYRSVRVNSVVQSWRTQKMDLTDPTLGDPITREGESWYDYIPKPPAQVKRQRFTDEAAIPF